MRFQQGVVVHPMEGAGVIWPGGNPATRKRCLDPDDPELQPISKRIHLIHIGDEALSSASSSHVSTNSVCPNSNAGQATTLPGVAVATATGTVIAANTLENRHYIEINQILGQIHQERLLRRDAAASPHMRL